MNECNKNNAIDSQLFVLFGRKREESEEGEESEQNDKNVLLRRFIKIKKAVQCELSKKSYKFGCLPSQESSVTVSKDL